MGSMEGPIPDRFDQLFGYITPFRSLVYSTHDARVVDDTRNMVGEVDMSLTKRASGDGVTEKRCVSRTVGHGQSGAMGSARGEQGVSELQARVETIESQLAQITQLLMGMSGFLGVSPGGKP